ncbi:replication factor A protein [Trifolium medium]|uniref:Replication factor A protein n=1 Tax=Trifolium medium TaxID=97028 RepID=A0A392LXK4_9FABA|nr:replication factor A protein [Trifolium medium]
MAMSTLREVEFDDIMAVNPTKTDGIYEVRVLRKWKVPDLSSADGSGSVDLVLIDGHGRKIQASIPDEFLSIFDDRIIEGRVYQMSFLSGRFNFGFYLPSYHRYKFVFDENSKVVPSSNDLLPTYGLSLIGAENILKRRQHYRYLVDVVGVVTSVNHDKDFFPDGRVAQSVTFKLNDQRKSFYCELSGDLVDEFRKRLKDCSNGLPIVVLQFVQIIISQGRTLVVGVEGLTRVFADPSIPEVINYRNGLVVFLSKHLDYSGLCPPTAHVPLSHTLDFIKDYPVRTIAELKANPELGVYIVNARNCDIVKIDPWWFPICKCPRIFEKYIGAFHCEKCNVKKFIASPKVRLTFEVDDETGFALFEVIKYFTEIGFYITPSKVRNVRKRIKNNGKQQNPSNVIPCTTTISELVDEYLVAAAANMSNDDGASSSCSKRPRV